jgi:hypothetical protein
MKYKRGGNNNTLIIVGVLAVGAFMFKDKIKKLLPKSISGYARAYEANSIYRDLGMNPYFMNYGDYGGYYGRGYDDYLSNPSPK